MAQRIDIIDIYHGDAPVDFHAMADAGVVGVILKATQGTGFVDSKFHEFRTRALTVFDEGCVHSYHFLDNSDARQQIDHYLSVTDGMPGRWLDYEPNKNGTTCTLARAVEACHILESKQGSFPGMYGSDKDLLGVAIDEGHFTVCPLWIARFRDSGPEHSCHLWQFQAGELGDVEVGGKRYDLNMFQKGDKEACKAWLKSFA